MKTFAFVLVSLLAASAIAGSWYENKNAGFGIYEPLGWTISENGRSATLTGPESNTQQTTIFLGSDWDSSVLDLGSLKKYVEREVGPVTHQLTVSTLPAFQVGGDEKGSWFVFREPENFIVIDYDLRGSRDQVDEGRTALGSIEIRTGGIDSGSN